MELWFIIIVCISLLLLAKALLQLLPKSQTNVNNTKNDHLPFPPGSTISPFVLLWNYSSFHGPLPLVKHLRSKFGPILTLWVGSRPNIWISDPSLVHEALIKNGAITSDRLAAHPTHSIFNSNQRTISSAAYGPTWRILRRNLATNFLSTTHLKYFSKVRKWAMEILIGRLEAQSEFGSPIQVREQFLHANFLLQCAMCFGLLLNDAQVKEVQSINRRILLGLPSLKFNILNLWPTLTKILLPSRWAEIQNLRKELNEVFLRLIKARNDFKMGKEEKFVQYCYVDSLLELEIPNEEGGVRRLTNNEIVSLCNEFINASTDLPTTELEWAMANLVKYPQVQTKLVEEIKSVLGPKPRSMVHEEDMDQMPFLKATILEVLRRHPPGHVVVAHLVGSNMELSGYLVPKNAAINILVAEIGRDPNVWKDPMEFNPERFLVKSGLSGQDDKLCVDFDICGRKGIKMMPFGVGRRMCPGFVLARLNLEYMVANLVWYFRWDTVGGNCVDLDEKELFTVMMKNPLKARITPRSIA